MTNMEQWNNVIISLIPSIRMKLPARPAPVRASIRTTSDVTTATADRNTNFCTNRTTEASPKMPMMAVVHRGSLAFPDRFIYGNDTIIREISISLRDLSINKQIRYRTLKTGNFCYYIR